MLRIANVFEHFPLVEVFSVVIAKQCTNDNIYGIRVSAIGSGMKGAIHTDNPPNVVHSSKYMKI